MQILLCDFNTKDGTSRLPLSCHGKYYCYKILWREWYSCFCLPLLLWCWLRRLAQLKAINAVLIRWIVFWVLHGWTFQHCQTVLTLPFVLMWTGVKRSIIRLTCERTRFRCPTNGICLTVMLLSFNVLWCIWLSAVSPHQTLLFFALVLTPSFLLWTNEPEILWVWGGDIVLF